MVGSRRMDVMSYLKNTKLETKLETKMQAKCKHELQNRNFIDILKKI